MMKESEQELAALLQQALHRLEEVEAVWGMMAQGDNGSKRAQLEAAAVRGLYNAIVDALLARDIAPFPGDSTESNEEEESGEEAKHDDDPH